MLVELIDLISAIGTGEPGEKAKDILGRVYEYFLGGFAGSEGKRGGEFYTPRSVVRVLVEMLEPYKGRVYDPCCASGRQSYFVALVACAGLDAAGDGTAAPSAGIVPEGSPK